MNGLLVTLSLFVIVGVNSNEDSIIKLYKQFKPAMAISNSLTIEQWIENLPTDAEKNEMFKLIDFIYPLSNFDQLNNSTMDQKFPKLSKSIQLTILEEIFCVIHEPFDAKTPDYKFPRFFGIIVIRAEKSVKNRLHHSAAHFETDGFVGLQAATMFSETQAKSLVIAGASRWAVNGSHSSECQPKEEIADAAHNTNLIFHIANVALLESAKKQANGQKFDDHFIQWHGMAETSCPKSPAFISIGANGSNRAYADSSLYANKLKLAVNSITKEEFAQTPKSDTNCSLRATNNVFGRVINGVHLGMECNVSARSQDINGNFLHIEQKERSRNNLTLWKDAFEQISNGELSTSTFTSFLFFIIANAIIA